MSDLVAIINAGWTPPVDLTQEKYKSRDVQWYKAVRMEFIGYVLQAHGRVYPQDIVARFGCSIVTAREDIVFWQLINGKLEKTKRAKSYERNNYSLKKSSAAAGISYPAEIYASHAGG